VKLFPDSGDGGEVDGAPATAFAWLWRLGLSGLGALLCAAPGLFFGLELVAGFLLWAIAWRGFWRTGWCRAGLTLLTFPLVSLFLFGLLYGAHCGAQDYRRGVARVSAPWRGSAGPGRQLLVDPESRVPLEPSTRMYCGSGFRPLFQSRRDLPVYHPTLTWLLETYGPMTETFQATPAEEGTYLLALEREGRVLGFSPDPDRGPQVILEVLLVEAATQQVVSIDRYVL